MAELLLQGFPIELLDGDAENIPVRWITDVLTAVDQTDRAKNIRVLSVLGVQSSGKSTLLNVMFGSNFEVKGGRCTKGVFMQFLPNTAKRTEDDFDHLVVLDTEGLRSPEKDSMFGDGESREHGDNILATFSTGVAHNTIFNVKGEGVTTDMKNILSMVVLSFVSNTKVKLSPSLTVVHQNVSDPDEAYNNGEAYERLEKILDQLTELATREEHVRLRRFREVIPFDPPQDVFYFPGLLAGGKKNFVETATADYGESATALKDTILARFKATPEKTWTLTEFSNHVASLWSYILSKSYALNFQNVFELSKNNLMEQVLHLLKLDADDQVANEVANWRHEIVEQGISENSFPILLEKVDLFFANLKNLFCEELIKTRISEIKPKLDMGEYLKRLQKNLHLFLDDKCMQTRLRLQKEMTLQSIHNKRSDLFKVLFESFHEELSQRAFLDASGEFPDVEKTKKWCHDYIQDVFTKNQELMPSQSSPEEIWEQLRQAMERSSNLPQDVSQRINATLINSGEDVVLTTHHQQMAIQKVLESCDKIALDWLETRDFAATVSALWATLDRIKSSEMSMDETSEAMVHITRKAAFALHKEACNEYEAYKQQWNDLSADMWAQLELSYFGAKQDAVNAKKFAAKLQDALQNHVGHYAARQAMIKMRYIPNFRSTANFNRMIMIKLITENMPIHRVMSFLENPDLLRRQVLEEALRHEMFNNDGAVKSNTSLELQGVLRKIASFLHEFAEQGISVWIRNSQEKYAFHTTPTLVFEKNSMRAFANIFNSQRMTYYPVSIRGLQNCTIDDMGGFLSYLQYELQPILDTLLNNLTAEDAPYGWWRTSDDPIEGLLESLSGCRVRCPFCGIQCESNHMEQDGILHESLLHVPIMLSIYRQGTADPASKQIMNCCELVSTKTIIYIDGKRIKASRYKEMISDWIIRQQSWRDGSNFWKIFLSRKHVELRKHGRLAKKTKIPKRWKLLDTRDVLHDISSGIIT
ncbi:unnamed protein product [Notodromas monacha]|uniref:VLIG-type G domain-containing protein n=1 Tax=Notodromas monacha TaxID=399045 RepID=A0A7R9BQD4_9CRUS|nr:unnamed protein product [Notodromas monacha]CAG0919708.1 unnamed protein product [Notodromas monacha]